MCILSLLRDWCVLMCIYVYMFAAYLVSSIFFCDVATAANKDVVCTVCLCICSRLVTLAVFWRRGWTLLAWSQPDSACTASTPETASERARKTWASDADRARRTVGVTVPPCRAAADPTTHARTEMELRRASQVVSHQFWLTDPWAWVHGWTGKTCPLLFEVEGTPCVVSPAYFLGWKLKFFPPDIRL